MARKLESQIGGASTRRRLTPAKRAVLLLLLWLVALVLVVLLTRYAYRKLYSRNDAFRLQTIEFPKLEDESLLKEMRAVLRDCGVRTVPECEKLAAEIALSPATQTETTALPEANFLPALPLREIRHALLKNPRIKNLRVRRIYPGTLRVEATIRVPVAQLQFSNRQRPIQRPLLLDQDGVVLPLKANAAGKRLPILLGMRTPTAFVLGEKCKDRAALAFLEFQNLAKVRPDGYRYDIRTAKLDETNEQMLITLNASASFASGAQLVLPLKDLAGELKRMGEVVDECQRRGNGISYINVTYEKRIPVRN